jgi:hypothetical protein
MTPDLGLLATVAAIFAAYAIGLALGKQYQREAFATGYRGATETDPDLKRWRLGLMNKVRAPVPKYGTDDPRDWEAALADPVKPRLTVVQS